MRPRGSPELLEQRRRRAVDLLEEGWAPCEVARELGVDRRSVRRWRASHEAYGTEGLAAKPVPGRPSKLTESNRAKLEEILLQGARAAGYPTNLWTCARVAELIRRRFRVRYHPHHVARLLRAMGFSPQKPERRARERNEDEIQRWVKEEWPRVKKTPRG
jgi:transposase